MAILILKHNALTPYANLESAKVGIIEKMATAQQGELWSAEYFTAESEGIEETKGAILAFKGKNGVVTFTDSDNVSEEMKTSLADYYTKDEIDELLDTKIGNDDVMLNKIGLIDAIDILPNEESPMVSGNVWRMQGVLPKDSWGETITLYNSNGDVVFQSLGYEPGNMPVIGEVEYSFDFINNDGLLQTKVVNLKEEMIFEQSVSIDINESYYVVTSCSNTLLISNTDNFDKNINYNTYDSFQYLDNNVNSINNSILNIENSVENIQSKLLEKINKFDKMLSVSEYEKLSNEHLKTSEFIFEDLNVNHGLHSMMSGVYSVRIEENRTRLIINTGTKPKIILKDRTGVLFYEMDLSTVSLPVTMYRQSDTIEVLDSSNNIIGELKVPTHTLYCHLELIENNNNETFTIKYDIDFNTKDSLYYLNDTKVDEEYVNDALESKADKEYVDAALGVVADAAISVVGGDGIVISGEGTEKTISTNVELEIKNIEGKEMIQLLDATDNSKVLAEVDASKFVVDGMLDSASIVTINDETELPEGVELPNGKYIKLTWNTDAGKSDTYVAVADLISEHKVVAGEDIAGEMVIVATNVVESTDENGIKVSTVNVTVDDSAVKSALDEKIGKEDVLYSINNNIEKTVNVSANSSTVAVSNAVWSMHLTSNNNGVYELYKTDSDSAVCSVNGSFYLTNEADFSHNNGELTVTYMDNFGSYAMQTDVITIDPNASYYLKTTVDADVLLKYAENASYNTKESIEYMFNTIEPLIDTKIGKDDIVMGVEGGTRVETLNADNSYRTTLIEGDEWNVSIDAPMGYSGTDCNVYDELGNKVITATYSYGGRFQIKLENGILSAKSYHDGAGSFMGPQIEVTSGKKYSVGFDSLYSRDSVDATIVTTDSTRNLVESIEYINNNINNVVVEVAQKLGRDEIVLSWGDKQTQEPITLQPGGRLRYNGGISNWEIEIYDESYGTYNLINQNTGETVYNWYASGPYSKTIKFIHNNGELKIIYWTYNESESSETITIDPSAYYEVESVESNSGVATVTISNGAGESFNTSDALNYLNNEIEFKANKSDVDAKIGKEDVMLSLGVAESTYSLNVMGNNTFTPYVSGNNWKITVTGRESSYFLSKEGEPQFMYFISTAENPTYTYTHNNGTLTVESGNQPSIYQIDPTASYRIAHEGGSTIEVVIEASSELNTKDSLAHLNDTKANKSEVEDSLNQLRNNIDTKIGHEDTMLSFTTLTEEFTEELIGNGESEVSSNLFAGGSYWVLDVTLNNYGLLTLCNTNGGEVVYNYNADGPMEKHITFTCNNGILTIDYGFQPEQKEINVYGEYHIKLHSNSTANIKLSYFNSTNYTTKTSIEYLNEQIQNNTSNKLGKFDTVLSVNDGETNTDYNVEGALEYLNNEIKAMTIIDCGVF